MIASGTIYSAAAEAGFDLCGIAPYRVLSEHAARFGGWLAAEYHSGMEYMVRNAGKRTDPAKLVENARTVVVCAVNYKNDAWERHHLQESGKVASYAFAPDYHPRIKKMLAEMLYGLQAAHPQLRGRCFTDTAPILEKAWAVEAGLGWTGKNSLLITPEFGSTILLGELVLDMPADKYDSPFTGERCGDCIRCAEACPNSAILPGRHLDTGKCISRITIEKLSGENGGRQNTAGTHGWIFGCDVCQSCCPFNARTPRYANPEFAPVVNPEVCTPAYWETLTEKEFDGTFGSTPLRRTGFHTIKSRL